MTVLQLSKPQKARGRVGEEVEVGRRLQRALAVSTVRLRIQSRGFLGCFFFKRCVAAFTQAREAQTRKAPDEAFSEELGEWGGWGGWRKKKIGAPHTLIMEAWKGVCTLSSHSKAASFSG